MSCTSEARVARYYDPTTAQFLTRDPLEADTGAPYSYAAGDPLDATDPSGMSIWSDLGESVVGTFDGLTFGLTNRIRDGLGIDDSSVTCSDVYREAHLGGEIDGSLLLLLGGATEAQLVARADEAYNWANRAEKLDHIFDPKHNFGPLLQSAGSRQAALRQILTALRFRVPASGVFETTVRVGGQTVKATGNVIDGVIKLGSAWPL